MVVEIRSGRPDDIAQIKQCLVDSWVDHARKEPDLLDEERMRNSDIEGYYQKCFESDKCHVLVAESGGQFAGFIRGDVQEIPNFFRDNKILYLDDTYVLPQYRRQNIARTLIQGMENLAKQKGIRRIQCRVYTYNEPVQSLLKSMGYQMPHSTWDKILK